MNQTNIFEVLSAETIGSLHLFQVKLKAADFFECVPAERAINEGMVEVTESSDAGSVNNLFVVNKSPHFVFFMDGDILHGAKQNRVLNTSVLLEPHSKSSLPVSCVEAGRWRFTSKKFSSSDYVSPTMIRRSKARAVHQNLMTTGLHSSNQAEVWNNVAFMLHKSSTPSSTSNLSEIFETQQKQMGELGKSFKAHPEATCLAIFRGNELLTVDVFNNPELLSTYLPKLVRGAAMEYSMEEAQPAPTQPEESIEAALGMFAQSQPCPAVAAGREKRSESDSATAFELFVPEDKTIHAAWLKKNSRTAS